MKHTPILIVLFAFGSALCNAQTTQDSASVAQGRLFTIDGKKIKFARLNMGDAAHTFRVMPDSAEQTLPASKVLVIQKKSKGSKAGSTALVFGGIGVVVGGIFVAAINSGGSGNLLKSNTGDGLLIALSTGAAFALVGAGIGALSSRYETVYVTPTDKLRPPKSTSSLHLKVGSPVPYSIGVGLTLTFGDR